MDPFASGEACSILVKQLERRWGVSIVSMLPPDAQRFCLALQHRIAEVLEEKENRREAPSRTFLDFYEACQLHTTHLTLVRSTPSGPVRMSDLVRPGRRLESMSSILGEIAADVEPLHVAFTGLRISPDGLGVVLVGRCLGEASERDRRALLEKLNGLLPEHFKTDQRGWDTDPSKYTSIHTAVGYLKRPMPEGYRTTVGLLRESWAEPCEFMLPRLTVVHHRYRSLIPPHEGFATFTFGENNAMDGATFVKRLNLIRE